MRITPSPRSRRRGALVVAGLFTAAGLSYATTATGAPAAAAPLGCGLDARFGKMFPSLPSATFAFDDLQALSQAAIEVNHFEPAAKSPLDDEMANFPAGYTYTGQFIDHDIVLDPRPDDLLTPVDPASLVNHRTPQLDLDSVYAGGPAAAPALYEADRVHLKLGARLSGASADPDARDLLRGMFGQALIGDPRNDENRIVGSLHSIFTRFHNRVADLVRADHPGWANVQVFDEARRQVTWHYQWAVLTDFLPKISGQAETNAVVKRGKTGWTTDLRFYDPCNGSMPLEFAAAAYRFGHSMVRNDYDLNDVVHELPVFTASFNPTESLVGFGPAPSNFATDWNLLFNTAKGVKAQNAYQIDNSLVPALRLIPGPAAGTASTILSTRNLLRGQQVGLPTGQDVARAIGEVPLPDDKILVGPTLGKNSPDVRAITEISPAFAGRAPLWTYILAEASAHNFKVANGRVAGPPRKDERLGPVGGRIVNETIVGLLLDDPDSVLNHPEFAPDKRLGAGPNRMDVADIVQAGTSR